MSDFVQQKNIGALITHRVASAFTAVTAGGAGDNTAVTGSAIQRSAIGNPASAKIAVLWAGVLAASKTLSLSGLKVEHSADGTTWSTYQTFTDPGVVATGAGNVSGQTELDVDLSGANDYIRFDFTPDLSNTATDTANLVAAVAFGGFDRLPSPT